jgi:hypothetical protein
LKNKFFSLRFVSGQTALNTNVAMSNPEWKVAERQNVDIIKVDFPFGAVLF